MDSLFTLDILDDYIDEKEFQEFVENLNQLTRILDTELYLEARVASTKEGIGNTLKNIGKNTAQTTKDVTDVYGVTTDAGASLIKGVWDSTAALMKLSSKILNFILTNVGKIPTMLTKVINGVNNIPENVRNKIKGNIKLYISANDIDYFYKNIFMSVVSLVKISEQMAEGDTWINFLKNRTSTIQDYEHRKLISSKLLKEMNTAYSALKGQVKFELSVIDMSNPNIVDIYMGGANNKAVQFRDLKGVNHSVSYYDGLLKLVEDLNDILPHMKDIDELVRTKFNKTNLNASFSQLKPKEQQNVRDSMEKITGTISIIGNLIMYVKKDMDTIEKSVSKILGKSNLRAVQNK